MKNHKWAYVNGILGWFLYALDERELNRPNMSTFAFCVVAVWVVFYIFETAIERERQ
jgi:tryptophan-rich sensory protein